MSKKLISICIPVYNEVDNIEPLLKRLNQVFDSLKQYDFEIVFTDNHSTDGTFEKLASLHLNNSHLRVIRFSRNFGFQRSIMSNFLNCRGDAALQLDADMQDPPEMIPTLIKEWENGYKVVYGIRKTRKENWWLKTSRKVFYRFIDYISHDSLPHDAGDFRLIDRCIIEELRKISDTQPYIRGLIAAMGFKQIGIPYDRDVRVAGKSKFNLSKLFSLALEGILQHSAFPLRIATFLGVLVSCVAFLSGIYYIIARLFFSEHWPTGLASLYILLLFSIGLNAIFLGIIGEYIGVIYKNIKKGSLTITEYEIDSYFGHQHNNLKNSSNALTKKVEEQI